MKSEQEREVRMEFLRPGQLEKAARDFPVIYVPFGLIEWHGRHLPLGTDSLKAHGILVECARSFGGVVYPPVYFHAGFDQEHLVPVLTELFERIKKTGFRVIIGVSGHNIEDQIVMIENALEPILKDGTMAGIGLWEISLSKGESSNTDHAAKWETSDIQYLFPSHVDLSELGEEPINLDMEPPAGIGGLDPREHASPEIGGKNVVLAAEALGRKAQELLSTLPEDQRSFNLESVSPENWWWI